MDFISNLIKRPISLVLNETSNTMDKYPIPASLPNSPNELENKQDLRISTNENVQQVNSERPLSVSSSACNDDIMTDFIGVPEEFLDEFKDILPPPPLPLQSSHPLTQSLLDMEITHSLSITPPPPPLTPSMKASQTIDELLSQINDNLQLAGLNDEVLAIASPPTKSELSPLSSKAALNNSKILPASTANANAQLNACKTPIKAAGPASLTVFENNSTLHKFPIDPELEACQIFDDQQATKGQLNISGVNKSSNKFVGLTEFDEAKIPELPGELNPNIEAEQYNITFEKCFVPTFNSNGNSADSEVEAKVDKIHLLLPTEVEVASDNDNETFADCNDDRDPLASTFAETTASFNITTDADSYQSAFNNTLSSNHNHSMDNIAEITLEAVGGETLVKTQVAEASSQIKHMDEDEPMDVDINATMEMLHNTSNNIQHVEKVLQHAENILQHLEEKKPLKDVNNENELLQKKETDLVINGLAENEANEGNTKDKDSSEHEVPLNRSKPIEEIEIEYHNEVDNLAKAQNEENLESDAIGKNGMNLSSNSNSSAKLAINNKSEASLNLTLNLSTSTNSQHASAPSSPTFPLKATPNAGFPRSPKTVVEKQITSPFLEKSDYLANLENQATSVKPSMDDLNGSEEEAMSNLKANNASNSVLESVNTTEDSVKRRTFAVITSAEEPNESNAEVTNKRQTFSIDTLDKEQDHSIEKRRTFSLSTKEDEPNKLTKFPSMDKTETKRLTFNANEIPNNENTSRENVLYTAEIETNSRGKSNSLMEETKSDLSAEQTNLNTSFEPMEVDDNNISQNTTTPLPEINEQETQTLSSTDTIESMTQSPPISKNQHQAYRWSQSPPVPALQSKVQSSPPLSSTTNNSNETDTAVSTAEDIINEDHISPSTTLESASATFVSKPLPVLIQKRPPIRDARARAAEILSAKEQSNIKAKDEKDILVEKSTPSPTEEPLASSISKSSDFSGFDQSSLFCSSMDYNREQQQQTQAQSTEDDEFTGNNNLILNPSDFDYLLTKGNNNAPVNRSSLLLKFDPLLGVPVPVNQGQPQLPTYTNNPSLSPTLEEDEHNNSNRSFVVDTKSEEASAKLLKQRTQEVKQQLQLEQQVQQNKRQLTQGANKNNATMSVDVIKDMSLDNDCNKTFENSNSTQSDDKQINYKMDELEKKIKNEVLKTEDIEKKLKDAEQREEALIKRITEKDKTITKMTGVIEAYEKAIAELIADKEQLTQNYEKQLAEVKGDRDSNYHHLTSLETTFSDLHVKYEKSKEMTCQLKESEEALQAEKRRNLENLHLQEQRYDKMKNHAMQQLEIANKKLESLTREHSIEITKLKALLKKEEIARSSINEQLAHKTKENAELVKICDELISGQGSNFSFEPFDPKKH